MFCGVLQAVAGLLADARSLSEVTREEASNFRSNYGHNVPLKVHGCFSTCMMRPPLPLERNETVQLETRGGGHVGTELEPWVSIRTGISSDHL